MKYPRLIGQYLQTVDKHIIRTLAICTVLTLAGCATTDHASQGPQLLSPERPLSEQIPALANQRNGELQSNIDKLREPAIYQGNDKMISLPKPRNPVRFVGSGVTLDFEQAPLIEVVHVVMGEILELDYIIEYPISGEVTIRTPKPIERDQLLPTLESLLSSNGVLMVRDEHDRYIISASAEAANMMPAFRNSGEEGAGYSNVIIPLKFIRAGEMADILRPVAKENSFVRIDNTRNLLVMAGTRNQVKGWLDIINTFDIDLLEGMSVGIFPLENSKVGEVATALQSLMGNGGEGSDGMAGLVRVFPLESLGSLIVVTPRAHYLEQIREWVSRLDSIQDLGGEPQLFVYPVQNSNSTHLATMLRDIFGGSGGQSSAPQATTGVAPGSAPTRTTTDTSTTTTTTSTQSGASTAVAPAGFNIGDKVKVVADEQNNALLIFASYGDYRKIEDALRKLDLAPTQVMIEASILEVSLTDELQYGLEWALKNNKLGNDYIGNATLTLSSSGMGVQAPGFGYAITDAMGTLRGVLNALAEKSLINVISSPSIMVLDNHTATIQVGDQQPIRSAQSVTEGGVITSSINYKDTGVKLSVTPSVNAGGMITMDVEQAVTDVGPVDNATQQRSFLERNINSRVAVRSGESVVLGGLIRDNRGSGRSGVPILHQIPIIGHLFGKTSVTGNRTELLVIITPRALFNDQDLREISREMRSKMQSLNKGRQ